MVIVGSTNSSTTTPPRRLPNESDFLEGIVSYDMITNKRIINVVLMICLFLNNDISIVMRLERGDICGRIPVCKKERHAIIQLEHRSIYLFRP
jgi:hypothetical protein